jgi:hypothetical protein
MTEKKTGTDDVTYNLVSVLYHTLKEAETVEKYIRDAEQTGDENLVRFFRQLQEEDRRRGDQAKQLLNSMLGMH